MSEKSSSQEDMYGQIAGGVGGLVVVFGVLAAIKDKLGLSWPATVALIVGLLVLLGYGAWRARRFLLRLKGGPAPAPATTAAVVAAGEVQAAADAVPVHPEMTAALVTAGAIGKDEVIRADEVSITPAGIGTQYEFLVPPGRTHVDVEKRLQELAGVMGVTRLHLTTERSRDNERRVKILKLSEPPFSRPFPHPTREEIKAFGGVPIGHDVTGKLAGIPTLSRASMLIAGMTQMGKTTLINGLITVLEIAYEDFDLYLLDGKFCGLTRWEKLATRYESSDEPEIFESMVDELNGRADARYERMREAVRNREPAPRFKPVIFIVDEAADFFASDESREGREQARRITEKTRSLVSKSLESEISVILMTQRPSTDSIPVKVRDQFLIRMCLYVASSGTAKVALGDTYFDTVAPINPALLDPTIKGQGVLFANGRSTLIRGFNFPDEFIWSVVDEAIRAKGIEKAETSSPAVEEAPVSPIKKAIALLEREGADFISKADLAGELGVEEEDPVKRGSILDKMLGGKVPTHRTPKARGYLLADLQAAARSSE